MDPGNLKFPIACQVHDGDKPQNETGISRLTSLIELYSKLITKNLVIPKLHQKFKIAAVPALPAYQSGSVGTF